jgi:hypothetical protein
VSQYDHTPRRNRSVIRELEICRLSACVYAEEQRAISAVTDAVYADNGNKTAAMHSNAEKDARTHSNTRERRIGPSRRQEDSGDWTGGRARAHSGSRRVRY